MNQPMTVLKNIADAPTFAKIEQLIAEQGATWAYGDCDDAALMVDGKALLIVWLEEEDFEVSDDLYEL